MSERITAFTTTAIVVQESPDGQQQTAYVTWKSDCTACGHVELILPAHHWRLLRDLLIEALDLYPHLAGSEETVRRLPGAGGTPS